MSLTPKQQRFVDEYLIDLNATQAAIRAGYSEKTAGQQGERLLRNAEISNAVDVSLRQRSERTQIDADYVLNQAVKLHERCMADGEAFNPSGAAKALELVGKHINIAAFKDRTEHSGSIGVRHEDALNALR